MAKLLFKEEVYKIIGACMNVHKELGRGFLEAVYHEALIIEFTIQKIPFVSQPKIPIYYRNKKLKKYYEPDFLLYDSIVLEIKAIKLLTVNDEAQVINTIKCCKKDLGLLVNFGELSLKWKRYIMK